MAAGLFTVWSGTDFLSNIVSLSTLNNDTKLIMTGNIL